VAEYSDFGSIEGYTSIS